MQGSLEKEFQQVGGMARPAGVPGGLGSSNLASEYYGKSLVKGTDKGLHALATASPYAERAEPGWAPKEPTVRPTWADKGAGVVSAGCIDNTYMPAPLKNKWGKCREMTRNEVVVLPHKQATDLLAVTLGTQMRCLSRKSMSSPTFARSTPRPSHSTTRWTHCAQRAASSARPTSFRAPCRRRCRRCTPHRQ